MFMKQIVKEKDYVLEASVQRVDSRGKRTG